MLLGATSRFRTVQMVMMMVDLMHVCVCHIYVAAIAPLRVRETIERVRDESVGGAALTAKAIIICTSLHHHHHCDGTVNWL